VDTGGNGKFVSSPVKMLSVGCRQCNYHHLLSAPMLTQFAIFLQILKYESHCFDWSGAPYFSAAIDFDLGTKVFRSRQESAIPASLFPVASDLFSELLFKCHLSVGSYLILSKFWIHVLSGEITALVAGG
jgi:hypothetical protein